jgi:hypothetical protein
MTNKTTLTWDSWFDEFEPILNTINPEGFDGEKYYMFDPDGEQHEFVRAFSDQNKVWTFVDGAEGRGIYNTYLTEKAIGYYITEKSFDTNTSYEVDFQGIDTKEEPNE